MSSDIMRMRFGLVFSAPKDQREKTRSRKLIKHDVFMKFDGLGLSLRNVKVGHAYLFPVFQNDFYGQIKGTFF